MARLLSCIATLALFLTTSCFALPEDNNQPLVASSDQAELHHSDFTGIYIGHVVARQGSTTLTNTDKLTVALDQNPPHQVISAIAEGNQAIYTTTLKPGDPPLIAKAQKIEYYPPKNQIILTGDASLTQQNNANMKANIIYINTLTHVISTTKASGRTNIIIEPRNKKSP